MGEKPKKVFVEKKTAEGNDDSTESNNLKRNARQNMKEETVHKEETSVSFNKTEEEQCRHNEGKETEKDKERKIRNKDRPAIQIYRPGSKRLTAQKQENGGSETTAETKREVIRELSPALQ